MHSLVFFIKTVLLCAQIISNAFLSDMRIGSCASLNLARLSVRLGESLLVLGMTLVNRGGVDVLIIVGLQAKAFFIFGELVPRNI